MFWVFWIPPNNVHSGLALFVFVVLFVDILDWRLD